MEKENTSNSTQEDSSSHTPRSAEDIGSGRKTYDTDDEFYKAWTEDTYRMFVEGGSKEDRDKFLEVIECSKKIREAEDRDDRSLSKLLWNYREMLFPANPTLN